MKKYRAPPGMDPNIWGPPLWGLIFDICWNLEQKEGRCTASQKRDVEIFFNTLQHLLPCRYCRESYTKFLDRLNANRARAGPPCGKGALLWAYNLKNLVNHKLKRKEYPSYEIVRRRMKTYTCSSNPTDLFDLLFIFAANFSSENEKKIATLKFIRTLPNILHLMASKCNSGFAEASGVFRQTPVTVQDVQSREHLLRYLCARAENFDGQKRSLESTLKKYWNCKAKK
jgi:hypothetical protein